MNDTAPRYIRDTLASGEPPDYISPSLASSWRQCPAAWRHRYVTQLPDPSGTAAMIGSHAHAALAALFTDSAADRTPERVAAHVVAVANEYPTELWRVQTRVANLWAHLDPATIDVAAVEMELSATFNGVAFRGTADLAIRDGGGNVWIVDWKTGKVPPATRRQNVHDQLDLYAAAYYQSTGQPTGGNIAVFLSGRQHDTPTAFKREQSDARERGAVKRIVKAAQQIRAAANANEYPTKPGPLCGWCAYRNDCPDAPTT